MARTQTSALRALSLFRSLGARLLAFGRRFWPLWLAWALVWALPPAHNWARLVIAGPQIHDYGEISLSAVWNETFSPWNGRARSPENPLPAATAHPRDLDLALSEVVYQSAWENQPPAQFQLNRLVARFPDQIVALALPVQRELGIAFVDRYYYPRPPTTASTEVVNSQPLRAKILLSQARSGQTLEPQNAFWHLAEVLVQWRAKDYDAALRALERAAKCRVYDDKMLEVARRSIAACDRYGALTAEEKLIVADRILDTSYAGLLNKDLVWANHALRLDASAPLLSLRWSAALASVGDLMQRAPNGRSTLQMGQVWQSRAWRMKSKVFRRQKKPPITERLKRLTSPVPPGDSEFAQYALALGRPDIARQTRAQAKYARTLQAQLNRPDRFGNVDTALSLGAGPLGIGTRVQWLEGARIAGVIGLCAGIYFALWWLAANLFLWRARAAPSSRRARVVAPVAVVAFCLTLALGATYLGLSLLSAPGRQPLIEFAMIALAFPAFFGAPFLLALWCAVATLRRHRAAFALPPRVDTELRLSPATRALLRWFLPAAFASCLTLALAGLALWLVATARGWGNVDVLALLPPDRHGATGSLVWDVSGAPIPLIYGIFLCVVCLPIWFARWRWTGAPALRPVTQSGVRWWKETLGGLVVTMSWLFLILALLMWPLRAGAERELDKVLRVGEIARLKLP